eukprot:g13876.t1
MSRPGSAEGSLAPRGAEFYAAVIVMGFCSGVMTGLTGAGSGLTFVCGWNVSFLIYEAALGSSSPNKNPFAEYDDLVGIMVVCSIFVNSYSALLHRHKVWSLRRLIPCLMLPSLCLCPVGAWVYRVSDITTVHALTAHLLFWFAFGWICLHPPSSEMNPAVYPASVARALSVLGLSVEPYARAFYVRDKIDFGQCEGNAGPADQRLVHLPDSEKGGAGEKITTAWRHENHCTTYCGAGPAMSQPGSAGDSLASRGAEFYAAVIVIGFFSGVMTGLMGVGSGLTFVCGWNVSFLIYEATLGSSSRSKNPFAEYDDLVGIMVVCEIFVNSYSALLHRHKVWSLRRLIPCLMLPSLCLCPVGAWVYAISDITTVRALIAHLLFCVYPASVARALSVLGLSVEPYTRAFYVRDKIDFGQCGFFAGLLGLSGPPLILLALLLPPSVYPASVARALLPLGLFFEPYARALYIQEHIDFRKYGYVYASAVAAGALGVWFGNRISAHISERIFRLILCGLLTGTSLVMLGIFEGNAVALAMLGLLVLVAGGMHAADLRRTCRASGATPRLGILGGGPCWRKNHDNVAP